jgi:glycosyltransferase involved in cell wall biosynthesis
MSSLNLTIVIPVRDEAMNLPGCLEAIGSGFAREVIVLDSGSKDGTVQIAEQSGARVIDFIWDGKFPKKRNWYLRNHTPATQWILFLDADEYLTVDFKNEVRKTLSDPDDVPIAFWLNYSIHFLGKTLIGGYPLRKLALFQVGAGEYEKIEEDHWSNLDMEIHEHPVISGPIGEIKEKIDHHDYRGVSHYVAKHNEYSSWEASRYLRSAESPEVRATWTWKQKLKYRLFRSPLIGIIYFFGSYIWLGGFRDGTRGLVFALLKMSYFTQVYCKVRELEDCRS